MKLSPRRRRTRKIGPAALIGAVLGSLSLAGCASSAKEAEPVATDKLTVTTAPATGDIDQLNWNLTAGEPDVIDPANATTYSGGAVVNNLCDPLLRTNPDFTLTSNLATYEQVSPTKVVFTLRDGAKFWDGQPVTAKDVAYSLNRAADPSKIVSFVFGNVKSITATGPLEVTVDFKQPDELFLKELGGIGSSVMEKEFSERVGDKLGTPQGGLMCSGPFKLDKWTSGDSITMSRNEDYWNDEYRARPAQVKFTFLTDSTAVAQALNTGELDGSYELPPATIKTLSKSSTGTLRFGPSTQSFSMQVAGPGGVLANKDLREALQRLVDRDAIAKSIFRGAAEPNYAVVNKPTWEPDLKATPIYQGAYDELAKARSHDAEAAATLVKDSGYDGTPIAIAYLAGDETSSQLATLIQQEAKSAGLAITLKPMQALEFSQAGYDATKRAGIDLMLQSSFNGVSDPIEPIGFIYLPDAFYNYDGFSDPIVTNAIKEIQRTFDAEKRAQLFVEAQKIYEADNAVIPLVNTYTTSFLNNDYTGLVTSWAYWAMPSMAFIGAK
jgi:peptide/nickel transport system substrate-binding protein